ncbi:hypothetical protein PLANTIT3_40071 [Plantibacter sp. T3]|nr:hypothetical protein PLANTIT3_40071 [Plantibacter sp. T3]
MHGRFSKLSKRLSVKLAWDRCSVKSEVR